LPALLIDERYNAGGQIPDRFIELLNRPRTNYWARRDGRDWPWPSDGHHGPKAMLVNGMSGSGGDMFPWLFRSAGLGEVIGTRTWGGLVGVTNVPPLIDGGYAAVPTFGFYEPDGTWGIEGYGVAPDVEVIADPAALARGEDPQIEVAVKRLLAELERNPPIPPPRPAEPDRRGMGVRPEDR
ncbi:MAG: S41 family peptidase, partial [Planctomycetota bacterium]